ncbi:MAG TPA: hypothetical protein EYP40_09190 [Chromatiales bacterium]|nr:hypothetical protein [Chromatiales bacterium]
MPGEGQARIDDRRGWQLIRRYLAAGMMAGGLVSPGRRKFPGYILTWHKAPRRRIAVVSRKG